jgi:hypothetical protein
LRRARDADLPGPDGFAGRTRTLVTAGAKLTAAADDGSRDASVSSPNGYVGRANACAGRIAVAPAGTLRRRCCDNRGGGAGSVIGGVGIRTSGSTEQGVQEGGSDLTRGPQIVLRLKSANGVSGVSAHLAVGGSGVEAACGESTLNVAQAPASLRRRAWIDGGAIVGDTLRVARQREGERQGFFLTRRQRGAGMRAEDRAMVITANPRRRA